MARPSTVARGARATGAGRGAVLVLGGAPGVGTTTLVSALCRALARRGVRVAPFTAHSTSTHVSVTADGGQVARAQALQALAARTEVDRRMSPVLLRPGPDGARPGLVVLGSEVEDGSAAPHRSGPSDGGGDPVPVDPRLRDVALGALDGLRAEHDVVLLEGTGSDPATSDPATAPGVPALLVAEVRRGSLASAYGAWALLPEEVRERVRGIVLTRHQGDPAALAGPLSDLERRTGVPVLGVLPDLGDRPMLGADDRDEVLRRRGRGARPADPVRLGVVALPHLANPSDLDALRLEPSVELSWVHGPDDLADADLVVLPGSRATVADLRWVRERGLDRALGTLDRRVRLFGVGAGYQMLGGVIHDSLESGEGTVEGLGLLPVETELARPRIVARSRGHVVGTEIPVEGYQVRWGRVRRLGGLPLFTLRPAAGDGADGAPVQEGCVAERHIRGTSLHGSLECDRLRHALLWKVAAARGRTFNPSPLPYHQALDAHVEHLADWVEEHLDVKAVLALAALADDPGRGRAC